MSGDKARERASLGKITLDGTVRILAVERADADTIRLHCTLVIPEDRHTRTSPGASFVTDIRKGDAGGWTATSMRYSNAAFDDLERQLREQIET